MSGIKAAWVDCDGGCGAQVPNDLGYSTVTAARMEARRQGWKTDLGGRDFCPDCRILVGLAGRPR